MLILGGEGYEVCGISPRYFFGWVCLGERLIVVANIFNSMCSRLDGKT